MTDEQTPAALTPDPGVTLEALIADIDEIRGAYGYLLMQIALTSDADLFRIGQKEESDHREAFARLERLLSRPGYSNRESWKLAADEIMAQAALARQASLPTAQREAVDSLLQRRGVDVLAFVKSKDSDAGYQVGMLLGDIARILNVNNPSLPPVSLAASRPIPAPTSEPKPEV